MTSMICSKQFNLTLNALRPLHLVPNKTQNCELILALDLPSRKEAIDFLDKVESELKWIKIGLQLFTSAGPDIVKEVADKGLKVFLDLKLHDIPNTVASTIQSLCKLPVQLTTLHVLGGPDMMIEANKAREAENPELELLGVTVLTSMDRASLASIGFDDSTEDVVLRLARLGLESGLQGLVCAPLELDSLRETLNTDCILVTPGIRPSGFDKNDQKRAATPQTAAEQGSSYIVVGRPILRASDPTAVIRSIQAELDNTTS